MVDSKLSEPAPVKNYLKTLRAQFFTTALLPVMLGTAMAYYFEGVFDPVLFLLTSAGIVLINAGTNLTNEYFDFKGGVDEAIGFNTPYSGGSMTLVRGEVKPRPVLIFAVVCFALGAGLGLVINAMVEGNAILWIGFAGMLSGFFYTAPPLRLAYRTLGEPVILLNLGPLATLGAFYAQVQAFPHLAEVLLFSLIPGIMMFNVLLINEFPDAKGDRSAGKNTIVNHLGKRRARWIYLFFTPSVYAILIAAPFAMESPYWACLGLVTLPFFVKAVRILWKHHDQVNELLPANGNTLLMHHVLTTLVAAGFVLGRLL